MEQPNDLFSLDSPGSFFSLKKSNSLFVEETERLKKLKEQVEYLLEIYSTVKVNNIRVKEGLINPNEYLKSLIQIIVKKAPDTCFGNLLDKFTSDVIELEKYLLINKILSRYGLNSRPLMIGGIPPGYIASSVKPHPKFRYGTIDYLKPLSEKEIADYELKPLLLDKVTIKWLAPEVKKALEIGISLPPNEITLHEGISLIDCMKAYQNKLPSSLHKHWQSMINRVASGFGTDFEDLIYRPGKH